MDARLYLPKNIGATDTWYRSAQPSWADLEEPFLQTSCVAPRPEAVSDTKDGEWSPLYSLTRFWNEGNTS